MDPADYYRDSEHFHADAGDYDADERLRMEKAAEAFVRRARESAEDGDDRPWSVLDGGCGSGLLARLILDRVGDDGPPMEISGIELHPGAAEAARQVCVRVEEADLTGTWPFDDETFDGVFLGAVLEHVFDFHAVLNEANRVLRPGGVLLVQVPNLGWWKEVRKLFLRKHPHWMHDMQHVHAWTADKLREVLPVHGFDDLRFECDALRPPLWRGLRSRMLERRLASWGRVLGCESVRVRRVRAVDKRLAARFNSVRPLDKRTVEVLDDMPSTEEEVTP